mgnify:FL=1|jgi:uncharacterized membrane protein
MQIDPANLGPVATIILYAVSIAGVGWAVRHFGWRILATDSRQFHVFAACAVSLMVLWSIRAQAQPGPGLHVLGVTTVTLLAGLAPACLITLVAQAVTSLLMGDAAGIAPSWVVSSLLPILVTESWRRLVLRCLPADPFAFIFGSAFFGAAIAVTSVHLVAMLLLGSPADIWPGAVSGWPGLILLLAFPEAFINGALMTLLVVYCPDAVRGYASTYESRPRL